MCNLERTLQEIHKLESNNKKIAQQVGKLLEPFIKEFFVGYLDSDTSLFEYAWSEIKNGEIQSYDVRFIVSKNYISYTIKINNLTSDDFSLILDALKRKAETRKTINSNLYKNNYNLLKILESELGGNKNDR